MMVLELAQLLAWQICHHLLFEYQMQKDGAKNVYFNSEEDVMRVFLIYHFQNLKSYILNVEEREVSCVRCYGVVELAVVRLLSGMWPAVWCF